MPNKTIYVSDDDLKLFARAQELAGGNLSAAIATAMRRYVELEEGRLEGWDEIIVRVGQAGSRKQRFVGVSLGEWRESSDDGIVMDSYHVYRSRGGKFVLHTQHSDWNELSEQGNWLKGLGDWRTLLGIGSPNWGNFTLDVFETLEELRDRVPPQFFTMVVQAAEHPTVEDLDI